MSSSLVDNTHMFIDKVDTTSIYWPGRLRIVSMLGPMDLYRQVTHCRVSCRVFTNTDCLLTGMARTFFAIFSLA
jgi:hypothetical protein